MKRVLFEQFKCEQKDWKKMLESKGLITFEVQHIMALKDIALFLGDIYNHPDSKNGFTRIRVQKVPHENHKGFTSDALSFHTDRSSMLSPPDLLLIYCCQPALYGGDSLLVDGKQIYHYLKKECPALLRKLFKPNSAVFGIERYPTSIFEEMDPNRLRLRFRADHLSFFDHSIHLAVTQFLKSLEPFSFCLRLQKGQGLIVKNDRYLHARTHFEGEREMIRVLIYSQKAGFQI